MSTMPAWLQIGKYLASHPDTRDGVQVLTKFCCFGDMMRRAGDFSFVEQASGVHVRSAVQRNWQLQHTSRFCSIELAA